MKAESWLSGSVYTDLLATSGVCDSDVSEDRYGRKPILSDVRLTLTSSLTLSVNDPNVKAQIFFLIYLHNHDDSGAK